MDNIKTINLLPSSELDRIFGASNERDLEKTGATLGARGWLYLLVQSLNHMWANGPVEGPAWAEATDVQRGMLDKLYADCAHFVGEGETKMPSDWLEDLGKKAFSYWGEEVATAEDLTCVQVEPGLPAAGLAGRVPVTEVTRGRLKAQ